MSARTWSNGNSHLLLWGIQNGTITLENNWVVSCKAKHSLIMSTSKHIPRHLVKLIENVST